MFKLTEKGIENCKRFIKECEAKRKEILDAGKDTAENTTIPTVEELENDVNFFGIDEDGEYINSWGVTDNYNSDNAIILKLGVDFIELSGAELENYLTRRIRDIVAEAVDGIYADNFISSESLMAEIIGRIKKVCVGENEYSDKKIKYAIVYVMSDRLELLMKIPNDENGVS